MEHLNRVIYDAVIEIMNRLVNEELADFTAIDFDIHKTKDNSKEYSLNIYLKEHTTDKAED